MIKRKDELEFLLKTTFGRTSISVLGKDRIQLMGKWFSECSYGETDLKRYVLLFKLVLLSEEETIEVNAHEKETACISRSDTISKIQLYFARHGVAIPLSDSTEDRKWLYTIMRDHLLPAIIRSDTLKDDKADEDIESVLQTALNKISASRCEPMFLVSHVEQQKTKDLYDGRYRMDECTYKAHIVHCTIAERKYLSIFAHISTHIDAFVLYQKDEQTCEQECIEYYLPSIKAESVSPDAPVGYSKQFDGGKYRIRIRLTLLPLEASFRNISCTYWTKPDLKRLLSYKGYSANQIEKRIRDEADVELFKTLSSAEGEYTHYCKQAFVVIDDLLSRLFSVKLKEIISGEKIIKNNKKNRGISIEECNTELDKIAVNITQVTSFLQTLGFDNADYADQCYLIIQAIMQLYSRMFQDIGEHMAEEFKQYISADELDAHKGRITDYIRGLNRLIRTQNTVFEYSKYLFKEPESIVDIYTHRDPNALSDFKESLEKYVKHLNHKI